MTQMEYLSDIDAQMVIKIRAGGTSDVMELVRLAALVEAKEVHSLDCPLPRALDDLANNGHAELNGCAIYRDGGEWVVARDGRFQRSDTAMFALTIAQDATAATAGCWPRLCEAR